MNVPSILETPDASPAVTRTVSPSQVSAQSQPTFKESLLAASSVSTGTGAAHQAGSGPGLRQKPVSQDAKLPPTTSQIPAVVPLARSPQLLPQQVLVSQQPPLIDPAVVPMQLPLAAPHEVAALGLLPIETNISQPAVAKSESVPLSHPQKEDNSSQAASLLPPVPHGSQPDLSKTVANVIPSADATIVANAVQVVLPDNVREAVPNAVASAAPMAVASVAQATVPGVPPAALPSAAPGVDSSAIQEPLPVAFPGVVASTLAKAIPAAIPSAVANALPSAFQSAVQASPVVLNAIPNAALNAAPGPGVHGAVNPSARGDVAPASSSLSASQASPPAGTPDPGGVTTGLGVPSATDQIAALIQPGGGSPVAAQASASSLSPVAVAKPSAFAVANAKDGANNAINDAPGLKQHAQAASDQTGPQTGSQGTAPSGDQSPGGASPQGQSAAPVQVNFANHIVAPVDHAQNAATAAPLQTAPTLAGVTGHTAKNPDISAPATIPLPQAVPIINTAKLIQSMGQSEMRIGMRSNDFGNISISASATRNLISAQISLDHSELARTLATHLPEMQARLGGNQAIDVRIDMNGQTSGQGTGTSPGMANGSADGSRGDRQHKGSAASSQSADAFAGPASSIAAAGSASSQGRLDGRLDIRA